ncbi:BRCT domain-containing protein [Desulfoluna spongiiphila]|uniref:BRCT domain-containing protein n=1 Tax=Desulfoluna spongiiphila TaxID=419481 RepID=A0A1G5G1B2_9BACT|nr:BRCT domain-containing protein [Desulfoluna spongiiphila]SCY45333.1 hypothetical protein SAMN05216233_109143 [Desulfoluna spongiiphila]
MPSELAKRILQVKGAQFSEEEMKSLPDGKGWGWLYNNDTYMPKSRLKEICFTGFSIKEKYALEERAVSVGFNPVRSVTKHLKYLCVGPNAGPVKLQKAKERNVKIITVDEFEGIVKYRNKN